MKNKPEPRAHTKPDAARQHEDLADSIAAVLNHQDTPDVLYNALQDALGSLKGFARAHQSHEYIRVLLETTANCKKGGVR